MNILPILCRDPKKEYLIWVRGFLDSESTRCTNLSSTYIRWFETLLPRLHVPIYTVYT